jgi:hypothetical protein
VEAEEWNQFLNITKFVLEQYTDVDDYYSRVARDVMRVVYLIISSRLFEPLPKAQLWKNFEILVAYSHLF